MDHYLTLGAKNCYPIYNALDPDTHFPVPPDPSLRVRLGFRRKSSARQGTPSRTVFLCGRRNKLRSSVSFSVAKDGAEKPMPANVRWIGHVGTSESQRVNSSARMVLNINRESMARWGSHLRLVSSKQPELRLALSLMRGPGLSNSLSPG